MIETVSLDHIPCFGPEALPLRPLSQITFLYGPNGSGKSSIAKSLSEVETQGLQQELFNKDFVDRLLQPDHRIPGVFVLRDGEPEVQQRIDELTGKVSEDGRRRDSGEIGDAERKVSQFSGSIETKKALIARANDDLSKSCWEKRKALPPPLQEAFQGFLGDSKKNIDQVHVIRKATSADSLQTLEELVASYETLGDEKTQELSHFPSLSPLGDISREQAELLNQPIRSKDNTSFGEFVRVLKNSDWVRRGLDYLEESGGNCPFCQQDVSADVAASLDALFDHHYEDQLRSTRELLSQESRRLTQVSEYIARLQNSDADEVAEIRKVSEALLQQISTREKQIESKIASPSTQITLSPIATSESDLHALVKSANSRIDEVNSLLRNRKRAKEELKGEVWRYYVHAVVDHDLSEYDGAIDAPMKALNSLVPKLEEATDELKSKQTELSLLQEQLTSTVPTVEAINSTLLNLGFVSFSIRRIDEDDTYQLVRPDGSPASHSLSEGERTLISFLYFFHKLIQMHEDRSSVDGIVALIDDPVSSLDGEMLFVINLLVRRIFENCVKESGRLKQVFLLTHNAYFYKESEFTPRKMSRGNRSYFVLTKQANGITTHRHYEKSPIKSNYTQLWDQVRAAARAESLELSAWLPNAMRRIIENYFQIAGGLDVDDVIGKIPEDDRWASHALLSWYNDGSHTAPWDVDYAGISSDASTHLRAFQQIFNASGHSAHYDMMMRDDVVA